MKSALIFAAVVCVSMALPSRSLSGLLNKRKGGDGMSQDDRRAKGAFSMALEFTTLMGQCELYYKAIAEETGNDLGDVPEDMQGVLYEACPCLFDLVKDKSEDEVGAIFADLAPALPLFQCVSLTSQKETVEFFVGLENSEFLQNAGPAFEACNTVFEEVEKAMEKEVGDEKAKVDGEKRSAHLLKTFLNSRK